MADDKAESSYATDEASQEDGTARPFDRRVALALLPGVIIFVHLPSLIIRMLWIEGGVSKNDFVVSLLVGVQLYLTVLCSIVLPRTVPTLASFDRTWFRLNRSEIVSFPLLVLGIILVPVVLYGVSRILHLPTGVLLLPSNHSLVFWVWIVVKTTFLSPFAEEIFWRGYVQSTLARAASPWFAILMQALLFGLSHFGLMNMLPACLLGIVFGIWCHRRKTLLPVVLLHIINNSAAFAIQWPTWSRIVFPSW